MQPHPFNMQPNLLLAYRSGSVVTIIKLQQEFRRCSIYMIYIPSASIFHCITLSSLFWFWIFFDCSTFTQCLSTSCCDFSPSVQVPSSSLYFLAGGDPSCAAILSVWVCLGVAVTPTSRSPCVPSLYSVSDITSLKFKLGEPELGTRLHYQVAARHLQPTMATGGIDVMTARISEACEAGEKFTEVFYETMDKRRQVRGIVYRCF